MEVFSPVLWAENFKLSTLSNPVCWIDICFSEKKFNSPKNNSHDVYFAAPINDENTSVLPVVLQLTQTYRISETHSFVLS